MHEWCPPKNHNLLDSSIPYCSSIPMLGENSYSYTAVVFKETNKKSKTGFPIFNVWFEVINVMVCVQLYNQQVQLVTTNKYRKARKAFQYSIFGHLVRSDYCHSLFPVIQSASSTGHYK